MIAKSYILTNLKALDWRYKRSTSSKELLFFSKLAILELCGWIEESMDDIIRKCAKRHLRKQSNQKYVEIEIIKRNYGFDYQRHFRNMLVRMVGLISVERIERRVDQTKRSNLEATLSVLKTIRDSEAHTHIKGVTRTINSPSITIMHFYLVYDGLKEFDRVIRNTSL